MIDNIFCVNSLFFTLIVYPCKHEPGKDGIRIMEDIRDKKHITHKDIVGLNFIKYPGRYVFRKYYKQGLRSQIMELLDPVDVRKQEKGESVDGIKQFPWAKPLKMLRLFRTKFYALQEIFQEINKYKVVEAYLPGHSYARSGEFVVDYRIEGKSTFMLCGLQDYVEGEVINPWELGRKNYLTELLKRMKGLCGLSEEPTVDALLDRLKENTSGFLEALKRMILRASYVPDLAGIGNLILTPCGNIKLVDINNISEVSFDSAIRLDDKGYPICDKSIEAISLLEREILGASIDRNETIYKRFLDPRRMKAARELEEKFHLSIESACRVGDVFQ